MRKNALNGTCGRYQDEGHLGSLRSPLRADTGRMGRFRGPKNRDQTRSHSPEHQWKGANQAAEVTEEGRSIGRIDRYDDYVNSDNNASSGIYPGWPKWVGANKNSHLLCNSYLVVINHLVWKMHCTLACNFTESWPIFKIILLGHYLKKTTLL